MRLMGNPIFRASIIVGSFAKGCPDRLSDIDLITFVEEEDGQKAFNILTKQEPYPVIHAFEGVHESKFWYKKYIFDNFVSAEIHIAAKTTSFKLRKPFISLFDHDNFLKSILEDGEAPHHEDFPALSLGENGLAWELHDIFKSMPFTFASSSFSLHSRGLRLTGSKPRPARELRPRSDKSERH